MPNELSNFKQVGGAIERARLMREQAISNAFLVLMERKPLLAESLIEHLGSAANASRWMCSHQRVFEGKTAYDLLSEGGEDLVWDQIGRALSQADD